MATTLLLVVALAAEAADPVRCEQEDLVRRIEVVYVDPGRAVPCEVIYDKSGEGSIETLWRAANESGYCEAKAADLRETLTTSGWHCRPEAANPEPAG